MMDCPLTNQGPYTIEFRIGEKHARKSNQSNLSESLSRALRISRNPETGSKLKAIVSFAESRLAESTFL
jgi:hypothetical protein